MVSLRKVVQSARSCGGGWELCATADARYDADSSTLVIKLDSVVQPVDLPLGLNGFRQPWLPAREIVKRRVPLRQARALAKEVFQRWTTKVRRTIPTRGNPPTD